MKVAELAEKINWKEGANDLFQQLVKRRFRIKSIHDLLKKSEYELVLEKHQELGHNLNFDFLPISDEYKEGSGLVPSFDPKSSQIFEDKVGNLISYYFPNSHLSGVFLYIADLLKEGEGSSVFGRELDHLMHTQEGKTHRIFIIECKNQLIKIDKGVGYVSYARDDTIVKKNIYDQLKMQIRAILQMVKPVDEMNLEIHAYAISSNEENELFETEEIMDDRKLFFKYMSFVDFEKELQYLGKKSTVFRVGESELLRRLRQGKPCSHLGHPDIRDAIEYRNRLRLTLDLSLFDYFQPKATGKWAINGTAGMGKSVLLAYAACVISLDCVIKVNNGKAVLEKYSAEEKGFPSFEHRKILIFALNSKQKSVVEEFFKELVSLFKSYDTADLIKGEKRPRFEVWNEDEIANGNVILIDEAHDLDTSGQSKIADWSKEDENYLIIACDRHQKLRLSNDNDTKLMIDGLNFSRETTKLKRVYRNPFSVYAAGLALMFRWFAPEGKKIIPSPKFLKESFGFDVKLYDLETGLGCKLEMVEDSHPANNWHHCLSDFPSPEMAYNWLNQYKLTDNNKRKDVLWVTFSFCDRDFDYQEVKSDFIHLDLTNPTNNQWIIDTSIKGQEFSIVVIEGVGPEFNNFDNEEAMLIHRRELYLCASRATVFLFFVHDNNQLQAEGQKQIKNELQALRRELSRPTRPSDATQFWGVKFDADAENILDFKQYEDLVDPVEKTEPEPDTIPKPETEPKKPESVSMPKSESDGELNAEESEPSSEEVTDRNLDSETDTETPQDLETVTEHKTIIGEYPQLAATSERRQDSKPVNTSDMSLLKINPGSGTNESDTGVNFEEESGEILSTQDEISYDLKNLSQQELSDLRNKLEKMAKHGGISIDFNDENLSINLSKPDNQSTIEADSELVAYNRKELGELNGLKGQVLKKAHSLYLDVISILNNRAFTIENKQLISSSKLIVQKSLLHPMKIGVSPLMQRKIKELSYSDFDKIKKMVSEFTDFLQFPINNKVFIRELQTVILIVCFPTDAFTMKLSSNSLGFAFFYLKYIQNISLDNVSSKGRELLVLRNNLFNFLSKHRLISVSLLALKGELTSSFTVRKKIKEELPKKDKNTAVSVKTKKPASENEQKAKSITLYSKEIDPNELAKKLAVSFSTLYKAKEELGQVWSSGKLDFYKAKQICSKFDYEIIDKSPKDDF